MKPFPFLSPDEVESIHQASLRILDEVGVFLTEPKSCALLCEAGATTRDGRLLMPAVLVEKCIGQAGKKVSIRGRGGAVKISRRWKPLFP